MDFRQEFKKQAIRKYKDFYQDLRFQSFKKIKTNIKTYKKEYEKVYQGASWGQSWRVWKGNMFEELIFKLIEWYCKKSSIGLARETDIGSNCSEEFLTLREQILIKYDIGSILPDSDIIVFNKKSQKVLAILSCKTSFRDRISMVGYWALKVKEKPFKYIFITSDDDNHFSKDSTRIRKSRLIMEDTDGAFILNDNVKEDEHINYFSKFQDILDNLINKIP